MVRVGVIGLGKMGLLHASTINAFHDATFVSASEPSNFIRKGIGSLKSNVTMYSDYTEMLDQENLDAVFITTPVFLHMPMVKACVERNINFFVEKPLAVNFDEVMPVVESPNIENLTSMVGFVMRYMETYRKGKEILENEVLKDIDWVSATIYVSEKFRESKNWLYEKDKAGGGVVIGLGCHVLDLLVWYFGMPTEVSGIIRKSVSNEVEDYGHAMLKFPGGLCGWLEASWSVYNHRLPHSEIVIHARNGQLIISREVIRLFLTEDRSGYKKGWTELTKADLYQGVEFFIGGAEFTLEDREFIDAVQGKGKVNSDIFQGAMTQHTIDMIYQSAHTGTTQMTKKIRKV